MPPNISLPPRDPLEDSLIYLSPLVPLCKVAILDTFWGYSDAFVDPTASSLNTYFEYYENECRKALEKWEKYDIADLKFRHVTDTAKMMKDGKTRMEMVEYLKTCLIGNCRYIVDEVVDLTARLFLMVSVPNSNQEVALSETTLKWVDGPVSEALERHFRPESASKENFSVERKEVRLEKSFTPRDLEQKAEMKILWTSNLLEHLHFKPEDNSVTLFHHASFLHLHKDR